MKKINHPGDAYNTFYAPSNPLSDIPSNNMQPHYT